VLARRSMAYATACLWFEILLGPHSDFGSRQTAPSQSATRSAVWERPQGEPVRDSSCRTEGLGTTLAINNAPIEIEQSGIMVTEAGTWYPDLYIRNVQPFSIQALAIVIEYVDKEGLVLNRVPVVAESESATASPGFRLPFVFERVQAAWKAPVSPGRSVRVQGQSDAVLPIACPTGARVTFAMVQSTEGATKTFTSPAWQLGPTPRFVPFFSRFPLGVTQPLIAVPARVMISAGGRVTQVLPFDPQQESLVQFIRDQMIGRWEFNPGIRDGSPVQSELTVLFRIHADRARALPVSTPLKSPLTLIDIFPDARDPAKLEVAFGTLFSGSGVR